MKKYTILLTCLVMISGITIKPQTQKTINKIDRAIVETIKKDISALPQKLIAAKPEINLPDLKTKIMGKLEMVIKYMNEVKSGFKQRFPEFYDKVASITLDKIKADIEKVKQQITDNVTKVGNGLKVITEHGGKTWEDLLKLNDAILTKDKTKIEMQLSAMAQRIPIPMFMIELGLRKIEENKVPALELVRKALAKISETIPTYDTKAKEFIQKLDQGLETLVDKILGTANSIVGYIKALQMKQFEEEMQEAKK